MKVVFITRSTLHSVPGGDTQQVLQTARMLELLQVQVDIKLTHEKIDYKKYDLLHFFNIIRPADILVHIERCDKPFVVSAIWIDYSIYDQQQRKGFAGKLLRLLPQGSTEYAKTIYRWLRRKDKLVSKSYLWKGQRNSIKEIMKKAANVFVQSTDEYYDLVKQYGVQSPYTLIQNGIDTELFTTGKGTVKKENTVLCVARIEGIKNQYNLIKALSGTDYNLTLIGDAAPNQKDYYAECRKIASGNVSFINFLPQQQLLQHYAAAKVHVLPSWFEVCGLSSLEAAAMGCQVIITSNGYASSYFGDAAFYCDPSKPESIFNAVKNAASANDNSTLSKTIFNNYTWKKTAAATLAAYKKITVQCNH